MADRSYVPPPSVRLARSDREWVTKFARQQDASVQAAVDHAVWLLRYWQIKGKKAVAEALEAIDLLRCEYQKQVERQRYFERAYQVQSRQLQKMRDAYEKELRWERTLRREYEEQLQRQRGRYEQEEKVAVRSYNEAPYGPKVGKLLTLAVCSHSDGEAKAAFEKARKLHRLAA
jgi:hypothetical protein